MASSNPSPSHSTSSPLNRSGASIPLAPTGTLGRLVAHFVASKRSLASTAHVYRANDIVSSARSLLESIAVNNAQTTYLRKAITNQLNLLKGIHTGLCTAADEGANEFNATLKQLDAADNDIQSALQVLKDTEIEPTFRPADEGPRSLHSFLDERGVAELKAQFHECIDHTTEARVNFRDLNAEFLTEIERIETTLDAEETESRQGLVSSDVQDSDEKGGPASMFRDLEEHASELAELLQSLVKHYDLCITALKHTEGGSEAAHAAFRRSDDNPTDLDETFAADAAPMTTQERTEMLQVLDDDATEVDDAVHEMRDRAGEMEAQLARLQLHAARSQAGHTRATRTIAALEALSTSGNLTRFVKGAHLFTSRWSDIKSRIFAALSEYTQLYVFFTGFQTAYQHLLLEIDRRRKTRAAMEKVIAETQAAITELYEEEDEKRNGFRAEYGDFLPADMWAPLVDPPTKWRIERDDDGTADIPAVRREVLEQAKQTISSARRRSKG